MDYCAVALVPLYGFLVMELRDRTRKKGFTQLLSIY